MTVVLTILAGLAGLAALVAGIWLLVEAFKTHVLWGLGSIFVPFVSLVFVVMHWGKAKKPFLISLAASVVMAVALVPSMMAAQETATQMQAEMEQQMEEAAEQHEEMASDSVQ